MNNFVALLAVLGLLLFPIHSGCAKTKTQTGLTGIDLTVRYDADVKLEQLTISGIGPDQSFYGPRTVPESPRRFSSEQESVVIILPDQTGGGEFLLIVDGLWHGKVVASARKSVALRKRQLIKITLTLGKPAVCGDGVIAHEVETCDDGNLDPGDGCSAECAIESSYSCEGEPSVCRKQAGETCGNGKIEGAEKCDDNNLDSGDGCSAGCAIESGYSCEGEPSVCRKQAEERCDNGRIEGAEECDDNNLDSGDGCSSDCQIELGYLCQGEPSFCEAICGDALVRGAETCDDGNDDPGDGCSAYCKTEADFECTGEPSACVTTCGNKIVRGAETCDDGNTDSGDGCSSTCRVESGYACNGQPSACVTFCGDGLIAGRETCDDANLDYGDGCAPNCQIENGYRCEGQPSVCAAICGDGLILGAETCDDANLSDGDGCSSACLIESGYTCSGEPSCCKKCGNNLAECGEACDGGDLRGETCLSQGYRLGDGTGLECNSTCDGFVASSGRCSGGAIDTESQIRDAISDAYAQDGHEVISIHGGSYALTNCFYLDECGGVCSGGEPFGVTLRPLPGATVALVDGCSGPVFTLTTGNNNFINLRIVNADTGFDLLSGAYAGNNVIRNVLFDNATVPGTLLAAASDNNTIEANRFYNHSGSPGSEAVYVSGENNDISMNAIYGPFAGAISIDGVGSGGGVTRVDNNSVMLTDNAASTGIIFYNASGICYRNNIVYGNSYATGLSLDGLSLASDLECGGIANQNNVNLNSGAECSGSGCDVYCAGGGVLCDRTDSPGFINEEMCLGAGSGLIDAGLDVGLDMWDDSSLDFNGPAPEVGARESGVSRAYGGAISNCP